MSRPVVARLAPFNRTSGPSTFDQAVIGSAPVAILKSVPKLMTVSSASQSTMTIDWATVSSFTTISLGVDTPYGASASVFGITITNFDRTYYDPFSTIAPVPGTASQFTLLQDGIYNFQLNAFATMSGTLTTDDAVSAYINLNGTRIRYISRVQTGVPADESIFVAGSFCRPLTAGTVVEFGLAVSEMTTTPRFAIGAADENAGVELYVTREATLVHVVPQ